MATTRYSTRVNICEDTSKSFELYDLLKQADPAYSAVEPIQIKLYVFDGSQYVETTTGYFTASDLDTLLIDMASMPNFNGDLKARVYGTDSSGNVFILDLGISVLPVNDAPSGDDETVSLANGQIFTLGLLDFGFEDHPLENHGFKSVVVTSTPSAGQLLLDNATVLAGQEISAADIAAGKLTYVAPVNAGGTFGFEFQVRDDGGTEGCGGNDLDLTPNTISFVVPAIATLGDLVWEDRNANGIQDAGEQGIAGVVVELRNASNVVVAKTTTDSDGKYSFTVPAGVYSVAVATPGGYVATAPDQGSVDAADSDMVGGVSGAVSIAAGESNLTIDAGFYKLASLGDRIWYDTNGNGLQDGSEAGVAGVTVTLLNAAGSVVATTSTDASGNYLFDNLIPGQYAVRVTAPSGYKFTTADVGLNEAIDSDVVWDGINTNTGTSGLVTLNSGDAIRTVDAGIKVCLVNIGDKVWLDGDADGIQDSNEAGIAGVKVSLIGAGTDGSFGTADDTVATTTTDASGNYLFSNLGWGSYKVGIDLPTGYQLTTANVGTNDTIDSDFVAKTRTTSTTTTSTTNLIVNGSFENTGAAAGAFVQTSSIQGWTGLCDVLEVSGASSYGVTGATGSNVLELDARSSGSGTGVYQNVQTVAGQTYTLSLDVAARACTYASTNTVEVWWGNTKIATIDPTSTTFKTYSYTVTGTGGLDRLSFREQYCDDDSVGGIIDNVKLLGTTTTTTTITTNVFETDTIVVDSCEDDLSIDAGLTLVPSKASIGNLVWEDTNFNGIQDAGEAGIAGVTVKLLNSAGTVVSTTLTDASGKYLFSSLNAGDYRVQVVTPSGYYTTKRDQGTNDAVDSDIDSTGKTVLTKLSAGENDMSWDAGLYRKACLGDRVWEDENHNGRQDAGESGIGNVKVWLWNDATQSWSSTYTDNNGNYKFVNLDPGWYQLAFDKSATVYWGVDMSTWYWGAKNVGTNDNIDADAYSTSDVAYTDWISLSSGEVDMSWDAAITPLVIDLNGDGINTIARENSTGSFDLLGTGKAISSGWISSADAFLAVDANENGKVDNISELFGGNKQGDGFAKLASFDSNGDGMVNADDAGFGSLLVWQDLNGNHQSDEGELRSLLEAGVESLKVDFVALPAVDANGNLHLERSSATLAGGKVVDMSDIYLNVSVDDAHAAGMELPSLAALLGDDRSLDAILGSSDSATETSLQSAGTNDAFGMIAGFDELNALYAQQQYALLAA